MLKKINVKRICLGGILIALTYVFTMFVSIPLSSTGYINLSDFFIIFTTISIDPICGLLVALIAPALADLTLGYFIYIPFTIISKGLEFLFAYLINKNVKSNLKFGILWISPLMMALVYIIPDLIVLGFDQYIASFINLGFNFLQGIVGLILALILNQVFIKYKIMEKIG